MHPGTSDPKEYPLFPELSEVAHKEALDLIEKFKAALKQAANEVIGDLYCYIMPYIESDSWHNFRNQLLDGFLDYRNGKIQEEYDFKKIRRKIFEEFKDEIIADLNKDLLEENEELKKEIEMLREDLHRFYRY